MFKLDMDSIRKSADVGWLMANLAIPAKALLSTAQEPRKDAEISHKPPELATIAQIAISQDFSQQTAELLTARLIAAAMRRCDEFGDGDAAREEMRADCLATPLHLQQDLLDHFGDRQVQGGRKHS